jgi:hypothetical protein
MINAATFLSFQLVGAALLALWVLVRFPRLGPGSLRPALAVSIVALFAMRLAGLGASFVVGLPHGVWLAYFGVALPGFFIAFLAAAWLLRVCAGMLGGSGGGPGEPVTARR